MWNAHQIISKDKYDMRLTGILAFIRSNQLKRRKNRQQQHKHRGRFYIVRKSLSGTKRNIIYIYMADDLQINKLNTKTAADRELASKRDEMSIYTQVSLSPCVQMSQTHS